MKDQPHGASGSTQAGGAALHPAQITLVRASFAILTPIAGDVTALFYTRLFELDPTLRPMFPRDMAEQGRKFITMLAIMVRRLDALDRLLPEVQNLGRRHAAYGVGASQYETMRQALLWALREKLGNHWTPDVAAAWNAVQSFLADTMIAAARDMPDDASHVEAHVA